MDKRRQRWLEFLATERRRRTEHRATYGSALEQINATLDEMHNRITQSAAAGQPWSPYGDVSMAERVAMFGRWLPDGAVDPEQEEATIEAWFQEHGY